MRPEIYMNQFLKNCDSKDQLNPSSISGMASELQEHWPYLDCPSRSSMSLWKSEWRTYGTCGKSMLNQTQYFKAALNLKKKVNFLDVLIKAGIKPDGQFYKLNDASEAIRKAIGYEPRLFCIKDKSGNSLLNLISGCTLDGAQYNYCIGTLGYKSNCGPSFKFPPLK
ncbi:hypothetical protein Scep_000548 [Stephania cephalantha]|uniref:Uncharacterized protein n=1 Tax=Stephania cephalantha TaxID=152367 RepID=A0AAP0L6A1_9MAGN